MQATGPEGIKNISVQMFASKAHKCESKWKLKCVELLVRVHSDISPENVARSCRLWKRRKHTEILNVMDRRLGG
jgi:hypothetical protein